ncbi:hypothetical protein [Streptomyces sp. XD-27]|uniref:hypothetical protein n=1 Tax=Streptomyces sp. XD-27 TaxID=3062779 RepID=UPI0026F427CA|nr:hypothetical protein [Streptomyces sp. XD-27]WKX68882.1 hypothetical protein Q3Y56_02180 [Streptomyces sp. XD-27]
MRALPIAAVAAALVLSLSACSDDSEGDVSACKKVMADMIKSGNISKEKPDACKGIDDETLQRLAKEVMGDKVPTPPAIPTPDVDLPKVP